MNRHMESHDPTPEFRAHLEWQIASALRRETRLAEPAGIGVPRLRAAVMLMAALAIGGIAATASEQVQDARQRDMLIESARSEEALVRVRLDLATAEYRHVQSRFEVGTANRETLVAAERQMRAMEAALKRIQLDIEEIRATSMPPRNELDAPVVGQRDYVRDRLALELETAQQALVAAERTLEQIRSRVEIGTAPPAALLQAESDLVQAKAAMQLRRSKLELRQRALQGELKAENLAAALRRMELTLQRDRVQRELEIARRRLAEVRGQVEVGMASPLDFKRVEVDVLEREMDLQRIRRELEALPAVRR